MAKPISESDIADLVVHVEESADALMAGDIDRYLSFIHHAEDYTLLNPAGGPARRGLHASADETYVNVACWCSAYVATCANCAQPG